MAESRSEYGQDEGMVADIEGQTPRTLSVLRGQRQYGRDQSVLYRGPETDSEMAEPEKPTQGIQLEVLHGVLEALPSTDASNYAQPVYVGARYGRLAEEPDEGNPQVRFCEGH